MDLIGSKKLVYGTGLDLISISSARTEEVPDLPIDIGQGPNSFHYYDMVHERDRDYYLVAPFYVRYKSGRALINLSIGAGTRAFTSMKRKCFNENGETLIIRFTGSKNNHSKSPPEIVFPFSLCVNYELNPENKLNPQIGIKASRSWLTSSGTNASSWSVGILYGIEI
jgi:hypothetical protein